MLLKRVLITVDAVGGVWRYGIELAAGLAARRIGVLLAVLGPPPTDAQRAEAATIPGLALHVTGLALDWTAADPDALTEAAMGLATLARREGVDTVHLHAPALAAQVAWPAPVVAVAHSCVRTWWHAVRAGTLPLELAWRADATNAGARRADVLVAPSHAFADQLRAVYGLDRRIDVVHNGRRPLPSRSIPRRRQVFTAGRLWDDGKNIATLDAAATQLDAPVLAAGSLRGPHGAALSPTHVVPLGGLDEAGLAEQYAAASVFVSVARYEPFGLAVLEAAQAGLPLVLSDIPTFRELWDGAASFVPIDDPGAIAAALRRRLDDPGDWGERARERAARYDADAMTAATIALHEALPTTRALAS